VPNYPVSLLAAGLLVAASVGPKLWLQRTSAQVDADRLNGEIGDRLRAAGFQTSIDRSVSVAAVRAARADCHVLARNGDRARELGAVFRLESKAYGPVQIGYRGDWAPHPAGARSVVERFVQDGAARIGYDVGRPAVIAIASSGLCRGLRQALGGLTAHASAGAAEEDM
jgi:hypothetical protein